MRAGAGGHPEVVATLPSLYAHRLGREPGPDSSRAALRATLAGPVDGLETDACLTADGRLVLLHDPWLGSSTTLRGWGHQTPWSDLRHARPRARDGAPPAQTPMLLEELLDDAPGDLAVQVEVKAHGNPDLARATAAAVCRVAGGGADHGRMEVLSFHTIACEESVRHGMAARAGVGCFCIEHFLLHPALVERLRFGGLSVTTGTINDAALAARAAALGVDAITTDRPAALHHELASISHAADGGGIIGRGQPAARSSARIRGWPSISRSSTTSTSSRPTIRPSRRRPSGEKPQ